MIKDTIVDGFQNAPHRSLYHALGLTEEEMSRPLIGIVSSYNEIVPGHMNLDKITQAVTLATCARVLSQNRTVPRIRKLFLRLLRRYHRHSDIRLYVRDGL